MEKQDDWPARSGIALALKECARVLSDKTLLKTVFSFLIDKEALGDRDERVRKLMLEAGVTIINSSGKLLVNDLLEIFSNCLSKPSGKSKTHDWIRESVVILLGTVSQHLESSDDRIPDVVNRLIETLKTPSEVVQLAVADCLPALVKAMPSDPRSLVERMLAMLLSSPKYAERRGAAYGLAGVVKGRGITSLKEYSIMASLKDAIEDKKK